MKELLDIDIDMKYTFTKSLSLNSTLFESNKENTNFKWIVTWYYSPEILSQIKLSLDLRFSENVFYIYTYL